MKETKDYLLTDPHEEELKQGIRQAAGEIRQRIEEIERAAGEPERTLNDRARTTEEIEWAVEEIRQTAEEIERAVGEIKRTFVSLYPPAMQEYGWDFPLYVKVYTQIRYYEDYGYGDSKAGYSLASKEELAEQFGVTVRQIERAFDKLTNVKHLGSWVACDPRVSKYVRKIWVSNARAERGSMEETAEDLFPEEQRN